MRLKYKTFAEREAAIKQWHRWFAWYPIFEGGTMYWLETIERQAEINAWAHYYFVTWHYRPIDKN